MTPLLALTLSTPFWGLALTPPADVSSIAPPIAAQVRLALDEEIEVPPDLVARREAEGRTRTLMDWIRVSQIGSNVSMAATVALAAINFADRYGLNEEASSTACATGNDVLGYCGSSTPYAYLAAAGTSGVFGVAMFLLYTQADEDIVSNIDGDWRIYSVTRLVVRVMNAVGAVFGVLLWNAVDFGWADEQRDFEVLQALSATHVAWSAAALVLDTANTVLVF